MGTTANSIRQLRILHLTLMAGIILLSSLAAVVIMSGYIKPGTNEDFDRVLQVIAVLLSAVVLWIGIRLFKRRIQKIRKSVIDDRQKLDQYRQACITWWAMIEGPGIFAIIAFLLSGNFAFLVLAGFHIVLLFLFTPRRDNIVMLLTLSPGDREDLEESIPG